MAGRLLNFLSSRGKAEYTTHSAESSINLSLSFYSHETYRYLLISHVSINYFFIYNVNHCLLEPNGCVRIRQTSRYMFLLLTCFISYECKCKQTCLTCPNRKPNFTMKKNLKLEQSSLNNK